MPLGQETRWAYYTKLSCPRGARKTTTGLLSNIVHSLADTNYLTTVSLAVMTFINLK